MGLKYSREKMEYPLLAPRPRLALFGHVGVFPYAYRRRVCTSVLLPTVRFIGIERTLRIVYRMCARVGVFVHVCTCACVMYVRGNRGTVACTCLWWLPRRYERIMGHISTEEKVCPTSNR